MNLTYVTRSYDTNRFISFTDIFFILKYQFKQNYLENRIPTEAISASQMSRRSLPEISYIDFSRRSMLFSSDVEELGSMYVKSNNFRYIGI